MKQCLFIMAAVFPLVVGCVKNPTQPQPATGTVSDIDGNVYDYVTIGSQTWMAEDLKTTHYNDGTAIPLVTDASTWSNLTKAGYCWYNNDSAANKATYGALYNWYAANTGKLAPAGWHVATNAEWNVLITFVGGDSVAGGELKDTSVLLWAPPNTGATNAYGFAAVPGGCRVTNGAFNGMDGSAFWWSATANSRGLDMLYVSAFVNRDSSGVRAGFSVRCVRD